MRSLTGIRAGWNRRTNLFTATRSFISPVRHAITGHAERLLFHSAWTARCRGSGGSDRPSDQNRGASPGFSGCSGDEDWFALPTSALSSLPTAKPSYRLPRKKRRRVTGWGEPVGDTADTDSLPPQSFGPQENLSQPPIAHDRDMIGRPIRLETAHSHIILTSETQQRHQGITPARGRGRPPYLDRIVETQNPLSSMVIYDAQRRLFGDAMMSVGLR